MIGVRPGLDQMMRLDRADLGSRQATAHRPRQRLESAQHLGRLLQKRGDETVDRRLQRLLRHRPASTSPAPSAACASRRSLTASSRKAGDTPISRIKSPPPPHAVEMLRRPWMKPICA